MSTRSMTIVKQGDLQSESIICMYRQCDGYLSGIGAELSENFGDTKIISGISNETPGKYANGMGCLSAQIVEKMKNHDIGNVYLYPPKDNKDGEAYNYIIYTDPTENLIDLDEYGHKRPYTQLYVKVICYNKVLFQGLLRDLVDAKEEDEE